MRSFGRLAILTALGLFLTPLPAAAGPPLPTTSLFAPAVDQNGYITANSSRTFENPLDLGFSLFYDMAWRPLELVESPGSGTADLISHQHQLSLTGAIGIARFLQAGLGLPALIHRSGSDLTGSPLARASLGDLRLNIKADIPAAFGRQLPIGIGLLAIVSLPTAGKETFLGERSATVEPRLIVDYRHDRFSLAAHLGYLGRKNIPVQGRISLGDEFTFGVAGAWFATDRIHLLGEFAGRTAAVKPFDMEFNNPAELRAAVRVKAWELLCDAGAGVGLGPGYGSPVFRLFAGVSWDLAQRDDDSDGVLNRKDGCPDQPEDRDGYEDDDGCPDPDNDQDGVADGADACPNDTEDQDGFRDDDGCPDPDNDQDGIEDGLDACAAEPEDQDGFADEDGCPDTDNDMDGVPDTADRCPDQIEDRDGHLDEDGCLDEDNDMDGVPDVADKCRDEPEDRDGFDDTDGCPDRDNDKDGVPDADDKCPGEPEVINGVEDLDGCPDKGVVRVIVARDRLELKDAIYFVTGKAVIERRSFSLLNQVAATLRANPEVVKVSIEGHTDDRGPADRNLLLSQERAEAVMRYLVNQGIEASRLSAAGYGESKPVDDNRSEKGRSNNRRVEFRILSQP